MKKNYSLSTIFLFLILSFCTCFTSFAQLPPIMAPIAGPAIVCSEPASSTYTASASNSPTSYSWSVTGYNGNAYITNPSSAVTSISFTYPYSNATYTLTCYAQNGGGTSSPTSFIVKVYETPRVTFSGATIICQGSSTNLSASPTILSSSSTLTYKWSPPTGLNTTTGPNVTAQPLSTTNYSVLLTLGTCTNTQYLTLTVKECIVGIDSKGESHTEALSAYPNPSSTYLILKSSKDELALILNEIGQTVRSLNLLAGAETRITGLPGGIYFVITPTTRKKIVVTN